MSHVVLVGFVHAILSCCHVPSALSILASSQYREVLTSGVIIKVTAGGHQSYWVKFGNCKST